MKRPELTYILIAALLVWLIFGTHVDATVTVPEDEIKVKLPTTVPAHYPEGPATDYVGTFGPGDVQYIDPSYLRLDDPLGRPGLRDPKQSPTALPPITLEPERYYIA